MSLETHHRSLSRNLLGSEKDLFKDADVLECDHLPDQILFRDAELEEMAFHIRPGIKGRQPTSLICRGLPATGKTTCIHHLFSEIREVSNTLLPVYVNCQRSRTAYAVYSAIYSDLIGHAPPSSGIPLRRLMDAVAKALQSKKAVLLVCLDDIHHLIHEKTATQILSSLLRIYLDYPGCRASVILVESDLSIDLSRALDRSVFSSLCVEEVFFAPYSAAQVRGILQERARRAVYTGVVPAGILDLITSKTMESGDLRIGIDLLKRSILRAEKAGRPAVSREDVAAAYGDARLTHLRGLVSVLGEQEQTLLSVIASMEAEAGEASLSSSPATKDFSEKTPPTSGKIYSRLREVMAEERFRRRSRGAASVCAESEPGYGTGRCKNDTAGSPHTCLSTAPHTQTASTARTPSCSYSSFYEQLRKLAAFSLIKISLVQAKGRTSEILLRYPAADVKRVCGGE